MLTAVPKSHRSTSSRLSAGLGPAYATLGLRAREARIDSIRQAAQTAAKQVRELADSDSEQECLLSEIAVCTYRLLDPRKRARQIERIQLSILSERALDLQAQSRLPLVRSHHECSASILQRA